MLWTRPIPTVWTSRVSLRWIEVVEALDVELPIDEDYDTFGGILGAEQTRVRLTGNAGV